MLYRILNYGSFGQGSSNHLAYELLRDATGMEIAHVAYKGGAPLLNGLLANEVQSSLDVAATVMPHVCGGKLKLLGSSPEQLAGIIASELKTWSNLVRERKLALD